jgi:hypothetical protein
MTKPIWVTLTHEEMEVAAHEGVRRRLRNLARGSQPLRGGLRTPPLNLPEQWKCDIEGAAAELAVSKVANEYWSGLNKQGADVGASIGVRHTSYSDGHLIIFDRDSDDMFMVLVTGTPPVLAVHGGIRAEDAKDAKYYRDGRPTTEFWVPQSDLYPLVAEGVVV